MPGGSSLVPAKMEAAQRLSGERAAQLRQRRWPHFLLKPQCFLSYSALLLCLCALIDSNLLPRATLKAGSWLFLHCSRQRPAPLLRQSLTSLSLTKKSLFLNDSTWA